MRDFKPQELMNTAWAFTQARCAVLCCAAEPQQVPKPALHAGAANLACFEANQPP